MYFSLSSHYPFSFTFKPSQHPNLQHTNHILPIGEETKFHASVGLRHVSEKLLPITLECLRKITETWWGITFFQVLGSVFGKTRLAKKRRPAAALSALVRFEGDRASLTSFTGNTTGHCGCMEVRHKPWESIEPPQVMEPETRKAISPLTYYYYPLTHYPFHSLSISCSSNVSSVRESLHPSRTPSQTHIVIQFGHHKSYNNDKVDFPMHDTCHIKLYCLLEVYLSSYRV